MEDAFALYLKRWQQLKRFYRRYSTPESQEMLAVLPEVILDLRRRYGFLDLLITGSLAFGMCDENSDIDLIYFGRMRRHEWDFINSSEREEGLQFVHYLRNVLQKSISNRLGRNIDVHLPGRPYFELDNIQKSLLLLQQGNGNVDVFHVMRLAQFYQESRLCLPVDGIARQFSREIEASRGKCKPLDSEMREITGNLFTALSFKKYNRRLMVRGVSFPAEIKNLFFQMFEAFDADYITYGCSG